jgi:hemoglobin
MMRTMLASVLVVALVGCGGSEKKETVPPPGGGGEAMPAEKTLFERLGGMAGIEGVVDEFLKTVVADARINKRFAQTDAAALRQKVIDQVCQAAGGPCTYTGKTMAEAHAGMKITEEEFTAFVEDLTKAMDAKGVPEKEKSEILGVLGPMKSDIVGK